MNSFVVVLALVAVAQAGNLYGDHVPFKVGHGRVVGGQEAEPHSHKYQVALIMTNIQGDTNFCGGSLLTNKIVLTAAHCVDLFVEIEVILGAHRMDQEEEHQVRMVSTAFDVHEGFNMGSYVDDIALIRLPKEVELNEYIGLTTLPSRAYEHDTFKGETVTITGWGKYSDSATSIAPALREASMPVMSNLKCSLSYPFVITQSHLCASAADGKSSCSGDSGGPLVVPSAGNIQVGIVSFGKQFCEKGSPAVYTRVTSYLDWLERHAGITIN